MFNGPKRAACVNIQKKYNAKTMWNVKNGKDVTVYNWKVQDLCTRNAILQLFPLDKGKENKL